jgi:uncharacterized protein YijF (DUF1287 family)
MGSIAAELVALETFWPSHDDSSARKKRRVGISTFEDPGKFLTGVIVTRTVPPHLPHIMIVSDKKTAAGVTLVIHNIGGGTCEEDLFFSFPLTGR